MQTIENRLTELEARPRILEKGVSRYRKPTAVLALVFTLGGSQGKRISKTHVLEAI